MTSQQLQLMNKANMVVLASKGRDYRVHVLLEQLSVKTGLSQQQCMTNIKRMACGEFNG